VVLSVPEISVCVWRWYVCSLVRKAYLELALVCFGSCRQVNLVSYGSLLPLAEEDFKSSGSSLMKVSQLFCIVSVLASHLDSLHDCLQPQLTCLQFLIDMVRYGMVW